MTRDERRASIVEATLPLLEQHGQQVTTKQISEAAGIAEGTIFRVFESLQDVFNATTRAALSSERLQRFLAEVEFPGDLAGDTRVAISVLNEYHDAIRSIIFWGHTAPENAPGAECVRDELLGRHAELTAHLAERFSQHGGNLTVSPAQYVELLIILAAGQRGHHTIGVDALDPDALIDFALHGASKESR